MFSKGVVTNDLRPLVVTVSTHTNQPKSWLRISQEVGVGKLMHTDDTVEGHNPAPLLLGRLARRP